MRSERMTFDNGHGQPLSGRLDEPTGSPPRGWAVFAHCFTCSKNLRAVRRVAEGLVERGFGVMSFDFTGLGESEGDFGATGLSGDVADLKAASSWLAEHRESPRLLVGHSFGGAAVLAAAEEIDSVRAVVSIAAPADPWHVTHLFVEDLEQIRDQGRADVTIAGRVFRVRDTLLKDLEKSAREGRPIVPDKPLLLFHSPEDSVVPIQNARQLYDASTHPKSFVSLAGADHLLSREDDAKYVAYVLAAWARRYVLDDDEAEEQASAAEADAPSQSTDRPGVSASIDSSHFATEVRMAGHRVTADEPSDEGGTDRGPTPSDLLLGALASCTAITLRMYADRKEWPLDTARVDVLWDRAEEKRGDAKAIRRVLHLTGELDEEQRQRLTEIAERCPVHRTLAGDISIRTVSDS